MVQFMKFWSMIPRSLSLPREIRLLAPYQAIGFRIVVISPSKERCVHMPIGIVRKLSC
jgi:hypothetical protein